MIDEQNEKKNTHTKDMRCSSEIQTRISLHARLAHIHRRALQIIVVAVFLLQKNALFFEATISFPSSSKMLSSILESKNQTHKSW